MAHLQSHKPIQQEDRMTTGQVSRFVGIGAGLMVALWAAPVNAKQCYAPDARAQERAFSRAVTTEGGKVLWLGGQTASLPPVANFDAQVRDVFASIEKTLKAQGGTLKDMVTMTVFITVSGLAVPGLLVEVQGIAVVGGK